MKDLKAAIEINPQRNVPRRIYDIQSEPSHEPPQQIAHDILLKVTADLQIKPDLSQLKFDQVKESILGYHVLYQQQYQGKPISGAWIRVDIDKDGKVYNILNDLVPESLLGKTEEIEVQKVMKAESAAAVPQLTAADARLLALEAVKPSQATEDDIYATEQVYYPHHGIPVLAWKVIIKVYHPDAEWKIYFDVISGAIIEKINLIKYIDGTGRVFDPNPVAVLNDTTLEDTSVIPEKAYVEVVLKELNNTGMLEGPYVNTSTTRSRFKSTNFKFNFSRADRAFKEVMVYFHIDSAQRYIQQLGFDNVLNHSIAVNIDGTTDDNSFYSPVTQSLTFGTGGIDDAEDAEVILHEYGHAIQDNQVNGFGSGTETRAMGEGFGDYLAASFFSDKKPELLKPTIGNWDAVAYSGAEPPCLRRLDSNKKYPKDMTGEEHNDGEIWSACLWEIRSALGQRLADRLILAHHFLLDPKAAFQDAANALVTADGNLSQGEHQMIISNIFINRGILPNPGRNNKRAGARFDDV